MNLANWLTISRIFLVPVFMVLLLEKIPYGAEWAAAVFVLAAATDGLDGYVARRRREITRFGQLIDPIADKLLVSAALLSLVQLGEINAWAALVIIGREFTVSGLRILAAAEGRVIVASKLGKIKTVTQIAAILFLILGLPGGLPLLWAAAIVTLASGAHYFVRAQEILRDVQG